MPESRSAVYRAMTREEVERVYHDEARRLAAEGLAPTSEDWSAALGQQILTVQYAYLPDQAPGVLAALSSLESAPKAPTAPRPSAYPDAPPPTSSQPTWVQPVRAQTVVPPSTTIPAGRGRGVYVAIVGMVLLAVVAAFAFSDQGKNTVGTSGSTATQTPRPVTTPQPTPFVPASTPVGADSGPFAASVGEPVTITCDAVNCMTITIVKVAFANLYKDPQGYFNDTPSTKGNVFMAVDLSYKATGAGADYNEFDWNVYVNDTAVSNTAFVTNGPKPELSSGDLSVGKSAAGWVVWEVPAKGTVTIEYTPGFNNAIFQVTLRP